MGATGSHNDTLWAVRRQSVVELRPRAQAAHEFVPRRELISNVPRNLTQLRVLSNQTILGLDIEGHLYAWSTVRGDLASQWRFPRGKEWLSMCVSSGSIYAVGVDKFDDSTALWKIRLPPSLAAEATIPSIQIDPEHHTEFDGSSK